MNSEFDEPAKTPTQDEVARLPIRPKVAVGSQDSPRIALITEAQNLLALELAKRLAEKGLHVILAGSNLQKVIYHSRLLKKMNLSVEVFPIEMSSSFSIEQLRRYIGREFSRLDVVIDQGLNFNQESAQNLVEGSPKKAVKKSDENVIGSIALALALSPLMRAAPAPKILYVGPLSEIPVESLAEEMQPFGIYVERVFNRPMETVRGYGETIMPTDEQFVHGIAELAVGNS